MGTEMLRYLGHPGLFVLLLAFYQAILPRPAQAEPSTIAISENVAVRAAAVSGNMAPSLFTPPDIVVDEGSSLLVEVHGTDSDATDVLALDQVSAPALGLEVRTSTTSGLIIGSLAGALGYNDAGTYAIAWSLSDGVNPPVTTTSTLTVRDVAPPPGVPPISVFPRDILQDVRTSISVKGEHFASTTWVELRGKNGTVPADTVVLLSSTSLAASVLIPASMAGQYDVVVTSPSGNQELPLGVTVSTYQLEAMDVVSGQPVPRRVDGALLSAAAPSTFQCEGINFCSVNAAVGVSPSQHCISAGISPYFSSTSLIYRALFGGFNRRCWVRLKVRALQDIGSPSPSGGHCHSDAGRPLGSPVDTSGFTTDGTSPNFIVQHRWPDAAGRLEGVLWSTDPNCPGMADSLNGDYIYCVFASPFFSTGFGLRTSGPGDQPIGNPAEHPTNWGMIPGMAAALDSVSQKWANTYPGGPKLGFNDASLPWGGLFDANPPYNWTADHCGHRVGTEMDLRSTAFTTDRQARRARFFFESHNFIVHPEKKPVHWHLYYAGSDAFRGPGSPIDWAERRYR